MKRRFRILRSNIGPEWEPGQRLRKKVIQKGKAQVLRKLTLNLYDALIQGILAVEKAQRNGLTVDQLEDERLVPAPHVRIHNLIQKQRSAVWIRGVVRRKFLPISIFEVAGLKKADRDRCLSNARRWVLCHAVDRHGVVGYREEKNSLCKYCGWNTHGVLLSKQDRYYTSDLPMKLRPNQGIVQDRARQRSHWQDYEDIFDV